MVLDVPILKHIQVSRLVLIAPVQLSRQGYVFSIPFQIKSDKPSRTICGETHLSFAVTGYLM